MPRALLRILPRSCFIVALLPAVAWAQATQPTSAPVDLLAAASWQYSTDGGKTFWPQWPGGVEGKEAVAARAEFQVGQSGHWVGLELTHDLGRKNKAAFALNGTTLQGPGELAEVALRTIPAIDPGLLVAGANVLTLQWQPRKSQDPSAAQGPPRVSLLALRASDLKFVTGPILGARGDDYITISCRTNLPAGVTARVIGGFVNPELPAHAAKPKLLWREITAVSPPGLFHQFRIDNLAGLVSATYQLEARTSDGAGQSATGPWSLPPLPAGQEPLRFVALGDSRSNPAHWGLVAVAALKARPQFLIHTGDLVDHGREDWRWNEELFDPAATLLATVPTFVVVGNHEQESPVTALLFAAPRGGTGVRWQQRLGPVQLIGIDGQADWSHKSENAAWLEGVLGASRAGFIFLITHYPAWTSGKHGAMEESGQPKERPAEQGQQVLVPLLARYQATAMIAGHDHFYERSQPPGGVTVITTGGGGAPLHEVTQDGRAQNPYSKVAAVALHYCLFTVTGDTCTMQAFTPDGRQLDTCSWTARPAATTTDQALTTRPLTQQDRAN